MADIKTTRYPARTPIKVKPTLDDRVRNTLRRWTAKKDAKKMIERHPPAPDPVAGAVADVKKNLETVLSTKKMTPELRQAIAAGAARAWYADIPGAATDIAGMILDYGVEGLKSILPGPELTGYNLEKDLRIDQLQRGLREPALGYKHLEKFGEKVGYIPPTTGTDAEFNARIMLGIADPVMVGGAAATTARQITKAAKLEKFKNINALSKSWESKGIKNWITEKDGNITLHEIALEKGKRGQGIGSESMQELIDYADLTGQRILLTPSTAYGGTSVKRLEKFYKRFGFKSNKGRKKDFRFKDTMKREPDLSRQSELQTEAHEPGPIFTSPGQKAAADIAKETIPANKVRSQLEGRGVNKDEMEWTGFNEWIKTKKGEVSKAEIEEFFAQNQIQVREVVRGGKGSLTEVQMEKIATNEVAYDLREHYLEEVVEKILEKQRNKMEGGINDPAVVEAFEKSVRPRNEFDATKWHDLTNQQQEDFATRYRLNKDLPGQSESAFDDAASQYSHLVDRWEGGTITEAEMNKLNGMFEDIGSPNQVDRLYQNTLAEIESGEYSLEHLNLGPDALPVKFGSSSWQLPGGENYRELVLMVPPKKVPWTKENVIPISAEEAAEIRSGIPNHKDWHFKTPDGVVYPVSKKQHKAIDYLDDAADSGTVTFEDFDHADEFTLALDRLINKQDQTRSLSEEGIANLDFVIKNETVEFTDLPFQDVNTFNIYVKQFGGKVKTVDKSTPKHNITQEEALQQVLTQQPDPKPRYTGGHFEENDVVAHIRFNERVDPDGNKVLFIEEIQGDWAHKGEAEGFKANVTKLPEEIKIVKDKSKDEHLDSYKESLIYYESLVKELHEQRNRGVVIQNRDLTEAEGMLKATKRKLEEEPKKHKLLMPDRPNILFISETGDLNKDALNAYNKHLNKHNVERGPFVTDTHQWTNLALKRMIRWGSDNGFDSIGWVTGKQSADRYKASTMVDSIYWNPETTQLVAIEKGGNRKVINETVPEDKLVDYIGKEPANKLLESPKGSEEKLTGQYNDGLITFDEMDFMTDSHVLQGEELDIGGEYHKLIYDQVLTAQAKKIGKKHGAKVEKGHVDDRMTTREFHPQEDGSYTVSINGEVQEGITLKNYDEVKKYTLATDKPKVDVWTLPLTDKLKQASKDGMPYYVALPPLVMGAAAQRTDAQRQQSKSDAQAILAN